MSNSLQNETARAMVGTQLGMAWWNGMTEQQRLAALRAADTDCPAEAWAHWRRVTARCEEDAHQ
jgi:hypothetical protein